MLKQTIDIKNVRINYISYGASNHHPTIVLLHGWGQNIAMMQPVGDALAKDFPILILDFPGFGDSEEPQIAWTLHDYCDMLDQLLAKLNIKNPIFVGHSFGGRVSLMYAGEYQNKPRKLILCGSPYKQGEQKASMKLKILRTAKKVPGLNKLENIVKKHVGSRDYRNATPIMRQTLVNVLKDDLSAYAKKITCPTILIWGSLDDEAVIEDGRSLEAMMQDAALIEYPNLGHYAYLENLSQTNRIIQTFLEDERK